MKDLFVLIAVCCAALACGSGTRDDRITNSECNARLTTAAAAAGCNVSAGQLDCARLLPEEDCRYWEEADVEVCEANVRNATSCEQALNVTCSLRCYTF